MAKAYTLVGGQGGSEYTGANPIVPGTSDIVIAKDTYFKENLIVQGDSNLVPSNIRNGVSIFNVVGNAAEVENVGGYGTVYFYGAGGTWKITSISNK